MSLPTKGVVARQAFLASVNAKPIEKQASTEATPVSAGTRGGEGAATVRDIDPLVLRFLMVASQPRLRTLTQIYDELGLSRAKGARVEDTATKEGLSRTHRIPTGHKGGPVALPEVLERGRVELERRGLACKPVQVGQGGFIHKVCARALLECGKRLGYAARDEDPVKAAQDPAKTVRVDVTWKGNDGRLVFFQIGSQNTALYEAEAILKAMKAPGVADNKLVFVAYCRQHAQDVMEELKRLDPSGPWRKVVETKLIGEVVLETIGK